MLNTASQQENNLMAYRFHEPVSLFNNQQIFRRPLPHQVAGEIRLAYLSDGRTVVGLNREELNQNILLIGRAGSGKTNAIRILQLELLRADIPFLAFELTKNNTRHLMKVCDE